MPPSHLASRASDLINLLHEALGATADGPVPMYLRHRAPGEPSPYNIGWLMQKVSRIHHVGSD